MSFCLLPRTASNASTNTFNKQKHHIHVIHMTKSTLIAELQTRLGPNGLLTGDSVRQRLAGIWHKEGIQAKAIVRPKTTEDVSTLLRLCHAESQSVVMHGGLTGLVNGALASSHDLVLSLERMNAIEPVDEIGRTLTAQSGAVLQVLQNVASEANLMLPLDLGARGSCTIGGNLATNAGGNKVIRYGMTRNLVLGLEAVLADGTVVSSMNRMLKNNAGYDLKHLFIGSEGTLGVITRVVLRLQEKPRNLNTALIASDQFEKLLKFFRFIDAATGSGLHAFEVMWNNFYRLVTTAPAHSSPPLPQHYPYYALIETADIGTAENHNQFQHQLAQAFEQNLLCDAIIAKSETEREALWTIRDDVNQLQRYKPILTFDVSVPLVDMSEYIQHIQEKLYHTRPNAQCFIFGHLGDGNLHIVIAPDTHSSKIQHDIEMLIYNPLTALHGSVSAEHGIGLEKKPYLSWCRSTSEIALMRTLKKALDPKGILNPGKIFDLTDVSV